MVFAVPAARAKRRSVAALGIVLATTFAACSATGTIAVPPAPGAAGTHATGTTDPAGALPTYVAGLSHVVRQLGPVQVGTATVALAARQVSDTDRQVDVLSWSGSAWGIAAALVLPPPTLTLASDPIQVADVTGDGRPDFLVRVLAADTEPGVIASDDGGAWRLIPLSSPGGLTIYAGRDPAFAHGHLTTVSNDCTPDCASGKLTTVVWSYDRLNKSLVPA